MKTLIKGEKFPLSDHVNTTQEIVVDFGVTNSTTYDYYCFGVDKTDKLSDERFFIFKDKLKFPFGAVVITSTDRGTFKVQLKDIPDTVDKLIFAVGVNKDSIPSFQAIKVHFSQNGTQKLEFELSNQNIPQSQKTINIIEIYRHKEIWKVAAVAMPLPNPLVEIIKQKTKKQEIKVPTPPPVPVRQNSNPVVSQRPTPPSMLNGLPQHQEDVQGLDRVLQILVGPGFSKTARHIKILYLRHLCWTLWFWIPFGAVFGWFHLALKTLRKEFFVYAILYSIACAIPYCLSLNSLNLGLIIVVPWVVGLIGVYSSFKKTFIKTIDSMSRKKRVLPKQDDKARYDLNTIRYETFFEPNSIPNDWAVPILSERYNTGYFTTMENFFQRCNIAPTAQQGLREKFFYVAHDTGKERSALPILSRRTIGLVISFLLILPILVTVFCFGTWRILESEPELKQHVYSFLEWDYYKAVQGTGNGVNRSEALYHAKVDALANGIGADFQHKEIGTGGIVTVSDDEGDKTTVKQDASEEFTKSVEGRVREVEILHEEQLKDETYSITIKAKVLVPTKKKKEE